MQGAGNLSTPAMCKRKGDVRFGAEYEREKGEMAALFGGNTEQGTGELGRRYANPCSLSPTPCFLLEHIVEGPVIVPTYVDLVTYPLVANVRR